MRIAVNKRFRKMFITAAAFAGLVAFALTCTAFAQGGYGHVESMTRLSYFGERGSGDINKMPIKEVLAIALPSTPMVKDIPKVEQLLERAMATSPEMFTARANLQQAQAHLNRVQLEVAQNMIDLRARWEVARQTVDHLETKVQAERNSPNEPLARAFIAARAELSQIERQLPLLAGFMERHGQVKGSAGSTTAPKPAIIEFDGPLTVEFTATKPATKTPKELDLPVSFTFEDQALKDVVGYLAEITGVQFILDFEAGENDGLDIDNVSITLSLKNVTLRDALQAIEDTSGADLRFVVRPYGILITTFDRARELSRETISFGIGASSRPAKAAETPEKGTKMPDKPGR